MFSSIQTDDIYVRLRECWVLASNLRVSRQDGPWAEPCYKAVVVEYVVVDKRARRQGVFTRLINTLCTDPRYELVIVEGVQNPILAEALLRRGWRHDLEVMDFYHFRLTAQLVERVKEEA